MIRINNITKKYDDAVILEHCSYEFPSVGIVCLMGASGGGKTTLLNLLAGFDSDYEGEIFVGGMAIHQMNADMLCRYRGDHIGFVFQNYHLLPGYTSLENVQLASELSTDLPEAKSRKAAALLARLGIFEKCGQKSETLSGGEKQRVAIARALMGDPQIILADEPTGALDREASGEIMDLLKEISMERLVVIVTHDAKICGYADETIYIRDRNIIPDSSVICETTDSPTLATSSLVNIPIFARAFKNFKVHSKQFAAVSFAISIGILAFLFSLSFGNVTARSIDKFKTQNTAFSNGYIKTNTDDNIQKLLTEDDRIKNVYYQYRIENVSLSMGGKTECLTEKFPMPKATESLSYGIMPRRGMNEISLTPSLAKKFNSDIKKMLGKELTLTFNNEIYTLTVSGIYNAGYDDFFISSDIEQLLYKNLPEQTSYSISYDIKDFDHIVEVSKNLKQQGIDAKTAAPEVSALQNTFARLNKLFLVVSALILAIGIFICSVLLCKLQNTRYHEIGLLSALGFSRKQITFTIFAENLFLSTLATAVNLVLLGVGILISNATQFPFLVTGMQIIFSIAATFAAVLLISGAASYKLVHTQPAVALQM